MSTQINDMQLHHYHLRIQYRSLIDLVTKINKKLESKEAIPLGFNNESMQELCTEQLDILQKCIEKLSENYSYKTEDYSKIMAKFKADYQTAQQVCSDLNRLLGQVELVADNMNELTFQDIIRWKTVCLDIGKKLLTGQNELQQQQQQQQRHEYMRTSLVTTLGIHNKQSPKHIQAVGRLQSILDSYSTNQETGSIERAIAKEVDKKRISWTDKSRLKQCLRIILSQADSVDYNQAFSQIAGVYEQHSNVTAAPSSSGSSGWVETSSSSGGDGNQVYNPDGGG